MYLLDIQISCFIHFLRFLATQTMNFTKVIYGSRPFRRMSKRGNRLHGLRLEEILDDKLRRFLHLSPSTLNDV